jgi:hypothetical protein
MGDEEVDMVRGRRRRVVELAGGLRRVWRRSMVCGRRGERKLRTSLMQSDLS